MTIINVCDLFAPIVGPLIGIINILILILSNKEHNTYKQIQQHLVQNIRIPCFQF